MKISEKTLKTLETANRKEPLICGYNSNQIQRDYLNLINNQKVEVGYRAGCGRKDKTHKVFEEWLKVIKGIYDKEVSLFESCYDKLRIKKGIKKGKRKYLNKWREM